MGNKESKTAKKRNRHTFEKGNTFGKGRPKNADSIAVFVRTFLEQKGRREEIIQHAFERAIDPDDNQSKQWADFLFNRAYGTPVNSIELSGKDGGPLDIRVIIATDFADDTE